MHSKVAWLRLSLATKLFPEDHSHTM